MGISVMYRLGHFGGQFISPEGRKPEGDINDHLGYIL